MMLCNDDLSWLIGKKNKIIAWDACKCNYINSKGPA